MSQGAKRSQVGGGLRPGTPPPATATRQKSNTPKSRTPNRRERRNVTEEFLRSDESVTKNLRRDMEEVQIDPGTRMHVDGGADAEERNRLQMELNRMARRKNRIERGANSPETPPHARPGGERLRAWDAGATTGTPAVARARG